MSAWEVVPADLRHSCIFERPASADDDLCPMPPCMSAYPRDGAVSGIIVLLSSTPWNAACSDHDSSTVVGARCRRHKTSMRGASLQDQHCILGRGLPVLISALQDDTRDKRLRCSNDGAAPHGSNSPITRSTRVPAKGICESAQ